MTPEEITKKYPKEAIEAALQIMEQKNGTERTQKVCL